MRTLEELRKEINGKQVVHENGRLKINALLICPPGGSQVSVKPYGYEPEEVVLILANAGFGGYDIKAVSDPRFCIASYKHDKSKEVRQVFRRLADIPDNGIHNFDVITKSFEKITSSANDHDPLASSPSCPYG